MPGNYVRLNEGELAKELQRQCLGPDELRRRADLNERTARRILSGERVWWSSARKLLRALGVSEFTRFIVDDGSQTQSSLASAVARSRQAGAWEHDGPYSPPVTTTNGLSYRMYKVRHQHIRGRSGRGKRYDLVEQDDATQERMRESLLRHPNVCAAVGPHPQIPVCWDAFPDPGEDAWWVVDEWYDGQTLAERLEAGPLPRKVLANVMRQVAEGLRALHAAKIVRRELSPRFIVLRDPGDDVLLTEFELAKLLDQSPTVSSGWPEDGYRAPEVRGGKVTPAADLYSWGRVLIHAASGELPSPGREAAALKSIRVPETVRAMARQCVHPLPSKRPESIESVLKSLTRWR